MRRLLALLLLLVTCATFVAEPVSAQGAFIEPLPEGFAPKDISADGRSLVGTLESPDGTGEAVLWRDGTFTVLRPSDLDPSKSLIVEAISADGSTIVGWIGFGDGWVWRNGTFETVGVPGADRVSLYDVSGDGSVIVGKADGPEEFVSRGLIMREGVVTLLSLPGGIRPGNSLLEVSEDGTTMTGLESYYQVVPTFERERLFYNGFFLHDGTRTDIAPTLDPPDSGGSPIINTFLPANERRSVVIQEGTNIDMKSQARWRVWRPDGIRDLPAPPGLPPHPSCTVNCEGLSMQVRATSASGARLGGSAGNDDGSGSFATIWDDLRPRRLADALADAGADLSGWTLYTVYGLSSSGQHLFGTGIYNGTLRYWRAVLPVPAVWAGAPTGFWDDPDRWAAGFVPDASVPAIVAADAGGHTLTLRRDEAAASLAVAADVPGAVAPPVVLRLDGHTLTLGPATATADALLVGPAASGYLALEGGTLDVDGSAVLGRSADAQGIVTVEGGHTLAIEGGLTVGGGALDPTGSALFVTDGTVTTTAGWLLGDAAGATGIVSVAADGSLQNTVRAFSSVGSEGMGVLTVDGGFVAHTGPVFLGAFETGHGRVALSNRASVLTTDSLVVGFRGAGELAVEGGSGLATGPVVLGARKGSVGSVRLAGGMSEWVVAGDLRNGGDGAAVLEVVEGARLCTLGIASTGPQGRLVTDGTLRLGYGDCTAAPRTGDEQARHGGTRVSLGSLTVVPGGTVEAAAIDVGPEGSLDGAGDLAVPVTNGGVLAPGGADALGTLGLAAGFEQTAAGTLSIELGAAGADALTVEGAAALGGTLRLAALPGDAPTVGASYDVVTAGSLVGAFDRVEAPEGLAVTVGATAVTVTVVGVVANEGTEAGPAALALDVPYPNPVASHARLGYAVPEAGPVRLMLYDVLGRAVAVVVEGTHAAGWHEVVLDAAGLPSGVYLARLDAGGAVQTRRLTVAR